MNKLNALYVALTALVVAVVALIVASASCDKGGNANVAEALKNNPEMVIEAMQAYENKQREEAMKQAQERLAGSTEELNNNPNDGVLGNPNGEVVLVEFFDFSCGYFHRIYPVL